MTEIKRTDTPSSKLVLLTSKQTRSDEGEIQKDEKETLLSLKQKYKDAVLLEIYESEKILHSILANRISVSASGLNAIIKKLNETQTPPIHIEKQGKFTFYSLEAAGKEYIQEELVPIMASDAQEEERVHNIFKLLSAFKDQNPKRWIDILSDILSGENLEKYEEGCGFIKELGAYHLRSCEEAENLLNLAVVDKELQKKILDYIEANGSRDFESVCEVMEYWLQENCFEVYRLVDSIFASIVGTGDMPDPDGFALTEITQYMDAVLIKIQTGLLRILLRKLSKWDAVQFWVEDGIEKNLAIYLAEKYFIYCLQYEQMAEKRKWCV